jgi:hypothetical protein
MGEPTEKMKWALEEFESAIERMEELLDNSHYASSFRYMFQEKGSLFNKAQRLYTRAINLNDETGDDTDED